MKHIRTLFLFLVIISFLLCVSCRQEAEESTPSIAGMWVRNGVSEYIEFQELEANHGKYRSSSGFSTDIYDYYVSENHLLLILNGTVEEYECHFTDTTLFLKRNNTALLYTRISSSNPQIIIV